MAMTRAILIAVLVAAFAGAGLAQVLAQDAIDPAKADAFDIKMFGRAPGDKAYACFVRRYDADHITRRSRKSPR
jgi:hypothetical protein